MRSRVRSRGGLTAAALIVWTCGLPLAGCGDNGSDSSGGVGLNGTPGEDGSSGDTGTSAGADASATTDGRADGAGTTSDGNAADGTREDGHAAQDATGSNDDATGANDGGGPDGLENAADGGEDGASTASDGGTGAGDDGSLSSDAASSSADGDADDSGSSDGSGGPSDGSSSSDGGSVTDGSSGGSDAAHGGSDASHGGSDASAGGSDAATDASAGGSDGATDGATSGSDASAGADGGGASDAASAPDGPYCGDGIVQEGEQCDDGNTDPFDGCKNDCTTAAIPSGPYWSKTFTVSPQAWPNSVGQSAVAVDVNGNIFVAGSFEGTLDLGKGALTSNGGIDAYLAKFDNTGKLMWNSSFVSSGGSSYAVLARDVAVDSAGNVYITGDYTSVSVDFGGGLIEKPGHPGTFVAKFDPSGKHLWSHGTANNNSHGYGVAVDGSGNVFVTGYSTGALGFACGTAAYWGDHPYVVKFSPTGDCVWAKDYLPTPIPPATFGGGYGYGYGLAVDAAGNVSFTGNFSGQVDFGGGPLNGYDGTYLARIDANGQHVFSKYLGGGSSGGGHSAGTAVRTDAQGNVLLSARTASPVNYGSGTAITGGALVKYSPTGAHLWSNSSGANYIAMDSAGGVISNPTTDFTAGIVRRLDSKGSIMWSRSLATESTLPDYAMGVDATGAVAVAGHYTGTIDFGSAGTVTASAADGYNLFLARTPP